MYFSALLPHISLLFRKETITLPADAISYRLFDLSLEITNFQVSGHSQITYSYIPSYNATNRNTNSQNHFWCETLNFSGSSSAHHQESTTVHSALAHVIQPACRIRMELQFHPDPARWLSSNLHNMCQCRMYSG
jgi:hypothetical protein